MCTLTSRSKNPRSMVAPTSPSRDTSPPCTVTTRSAKTPTDTKASDTSPSRNTPPTSMNGLVPSPTSTEADARTVAGPAVHSTDHPAPKPTQKPSNVNRGSPPSRTSRPPSIIRYDQTLARSESGNNVAVTGSPVRLSTPSAPMRTYVSDGRPGKYAETGTRTSMTPVNS